MTYAQHTYTRRYMSWDEAPAVLTVEDASILLGVKQDTLRNYLRDGTVPGIKIGTSWKIDKAQLQKMFG